MKSKTVTIDFGTLFLHGASDARLLTNEIEKTMQVNGETIIERGAYKHRTDAGDVPMRLKVTVELTEG